MLLLHLSAFLYTEPSLNESRPSLTNHGKLPVGEFSPLFIFNCIYIFSGLNSVYVYRIVAETTQYTSSSDNLNKGG